ncbi:MAG: hypothetical protein JST54_32635 [Deltaproteobacteria bacterium]|nr:hypothetical protein [Deltaproteobacteria bacterium]
MDAQALGVVTGLVTLAAVRSRAALFLRPGGVTIRVEPFSPVPPALAEDARALEVLGFRPLGIQRETQPLALAPSTRAWVFVSEELGAYANLVESAIMPFGYMLSVFPTGAVALTGRYPRARSVAEDLVIQGLPRASWAEVLSTHRREVDLLAAVHDSPRAPATPEGRVAAARAYYDHPYQLARTRRAHAAFAIVAVAALTAVVACAFRLASAA